MRPGLAGLGGAIETLGVSHRFESGLSAGLGFDGITIALLAGRTQGILYGAITGVLTDITLTIPTGLVSALYTIAGFLAGWIGRKMRVRILSSIVAPIVSMLVYELTMLVYYFMQAQTVAASQALAMLARVGIGTVLIQPLYLLYNLVLKPKRSRYAR